MFKLLMLSALAIIVAAQSSSSPATPTVTGATTQNVSAATESTVAGNTGATSAPVTETSAVTPTTGSSCSDKNPDCVNKASLCQANGYVEFMKQQCTQTCGYCSGVSTQTSCADNDTRCSTWSKNGYCSNAFYTPETKKQTCAKTCNLC